MATGSRCSISHGWRPSASLPADIGQLLDLRASGSGDTNPAEATLSVDGRAILPPSPIGAVLREDDGDLVVGWTRRSRLGWLWRDLADVPLAEERVAYRVSVTAGGLTLREVEVGTPAWTYVGARPRRRSAGSGGGAPVGLRICQIGTFGPGRPLAVEL